MANPLANDIDNPFINLIDKYSDPHHFTNNSYRVLEMPVTASLKELIKRGQLIEVAQTTGADIPDGKMKILPIKDVLGDDDDNHAIRRLDSPDDRVLDILFWFWPIDTGKGGDDEPLKLLILGEVESAIDLWEKGVQEIKNPGICAHNLAVYYTISAIQLEGNTIKNDTYSMDQIDAMWRLAGKYWESAHESEEVWSEYIKYISLVGDPRVTSGYNRKVRKYLPTIFTCVVGKIALNYAEAGLINNTQRLLKHIRSLSFLNEDIDQGLKIAASRIETRIRSFIKQEANKTNSDPHHTYAFAQTIINDHLPLLETLKLFVSETNSYTSIADLLAQAVFDSTREYLSKTEDWENGIETLEQACDIAISKVLKEKIQKDIDRGYEELATGDFYYSPGYFQLPQEIFTKAEQARNSLNSGNPEEAVLQLYRLINGNISQKTITTPLYRAVSYCLVRKVIAAFNKTTSTLDEPRYILREASQRSSLLHLVDRIYVGSPDVGCACCGREFSYYNRTYYQIVIEDTKFTVCEFCKERDQQEMESRRALIRATLKQNCDDLQLATQYNPNNNRAKKELTEIRQISEKFSPVQQTYKPPSVSNNREPATNNGGCMLAVMTIVLIISIGIFI